MLLLLCGYHAHAVVVAVFHEKSGSFAGLRRTSEVSLFVGSWH